MKKLRRKIIEKSFLVATVLGGGQLNSCIGLGFAQHIGIPSIYDVASLTNDLNSYYNNSPTDIVNYSPIEDTTPPQITCVSNSAFITYDSNGNLVPVCP